MINKNDLDNYLTGHYGEDQYFYAKEDLEETTEVEEGDYPDW